MNAPKSLSRRRFLLLASLLGSVKASSAGDGTKRGDNGIDGTGFRPGDKGIGGAGFVGTIRKFGSVYVNGERIVYPADASIEIDGVRSAPGDMRLGQVARLVAERRDQTWTTDRIVIVSEAIGPVKRISGKSVEILGHRVLLPSRKIARAVKIGDRLAIGGLRRPDQTIVAFSVVRAIGGLDQIAGLVARDAGGGVSIGDQRVAGLGDALIGPRVVARGGLENGIFIAREARREAEIGIAGARNVSVETWVRRRDDGLETAGGVRVETSRDERRAAGRLVVVNGAFAPDGSLIAQRIETVRPHDYFNPPGGGRGPQGPGGAGGPQGPAGGGRPGGTGGPGGSNAPPGGAPYPGPGGLQQHGSGGFELRGFGGGAPAPGPGEGFPSGGAPFGGPPPFPSGGGFLGPPGGRPR